MDNRPNPMGRKRPIIETVKSTTIIFFALSAIAVLYNFALAARVFTMAMVMLVIYIFMLFSKKHKLNGRKKETE
nr:hypothetical protein [uncultured Granulicatella sp.]